MPHPKPEEMLVKLWRCPNQCKNRHAFYCHGTPHEHNHECECPVCYGGARKPCIDVGFRLPAESTPTRPPGFIGTVEADKPCLTCKHAAKNGSCAQRGMGCRFYGPENTCVFPLWELKTISKTKLV